MQTGNLTSQYSWLTITLLLVLVLSYSQQCLTLSDVTFNRTPAAINRKSPSATTPTEAKQSPSVGCAALQLHTQSDSNQDNEYYIKKLDKQTHPCIRQTAAIVNTTINTTTTTTNSSTNKNSQSFALLANNQNEIDFCPCYDTAKECQKCHNELQNNYVEIAPNLVDACCR